MGHLLSAVVYSVPGWDVGSYCCYGYWRSPALTAGTAAGGHWPS